MANSDEDRAITIDPKHPKDFVDRVGMEVNGRFYSFREIRELLEKHSQKVSTGPSEEPQ